MVDLVNSFLKWLFYKPFLNPLFNMIGGWLNCAPNAVKRYASSALTRYFQPSMIRLIGFVLIPAAIIIALYVLGRLNPGNLPKYAPDKMKKNKASALTGKKIIFLGSSVTKGFAACGKSFVDMIAWRNDAVCVKEAVSGTTLVEAGGKNYITRLKALDKSQPCDLFVCQLSTNDATKNKPLGTVAASTELTSFDTSTVCGAIEYIIAYAKETWHCPVVFYTSPLYNDERYAAMVDALAKISAKWGVSVVDLWHDPEVNNHRSHSYMNDSIHPTRKGYQVWTPVFEKALSAVLGGKSLPAVPEGKPEKAPLKKKRTQKLILRIIAAILVFVLLFSTLCAIAGFLYVSNMFGFKEPGNAKIYYLDNVVPHEGTTPLTGLRILGVGSSVMMGYSARCIGPGEYLAALNKATYVKETATGTSVTSTTGPTMDGAGTYLPRLMQHTAEENFDLVIIQLGTNDCADWVVVGEPTNTASLNLGDYDEYTFCGAMESMIAYSLNTWSGCKVVIYSNTTFSDKNVEKYESMVQQTQEIVNKWHNAGQEVYLMDMWHDDELNDVDPSLVSLYNAGQIHPRMAGYLEWWMPCWEEFLYPLFENK